ncbi:hypothetical protein Pmar_PMAR020203 [Perkinsus marinus ATCC 50983]|uniref:Uncharacterized protein n=1 Tax=Perkinsus marinus (strain ATCC 50983 / TXsc) TaxID=423536 RepID=C5K8N6_PERM5|nr:hypothetical protein Pmar_PMAR020203 [Perkinsus marinus ATCC 50983]EER19155.1 hypothetical protein Pmar_PMAR020203 [Perkinsus marinus ATCC 50983]|eukprot:XP_002787359.1 hypothetical protein Pmar_PMAR020203 [Perkinsus marinus ATCC 50983]
MLKNTEPGIRTSVFVVEPESPYRARAKHDLKQSIMKYLSRRLKGIDAGKKYRPDYDPEPYFFRWKRQFLSWAHDRRYRDTGARRPLTQQQQQSE